MFFITITVLDENLDCASRVLATARAFFGVVDDGATEMRVGARDTRKGRETLLSFEVQPIQGVDVERSGAALASVLGTLLVDSGVERADVRVFVSSAQVARPAQHAGFSG